MPLETYRRKRHFDATPETVFDQVRRRRPTLFFGMPTAYARMLAAMESGAEADFSSVRSCASAGEALPASVWERWRERTGLEILDGIGSSEICLCFISNHPGDVRPGSSGRVVRGYDVRLVDESGVDVPVGEIGDLLVRGDSTMAFYWNKHEATKRTLAGDWIRPATSIARMRTASSGTPAEATTCSRSAASGSRRSKSRRCSPPTPRSWNAPSSCGRTATGSSRRTRSWCGARAPEPPDFPRRCGRSRASGSRPTSARAGSPSFRSCRRRRRGRSSDSGLREAAAAAPD